MRLRISVWLITLVMVVVAVMPTAAQPDGQTIDAGVYSFVLPADWVTRAEGTTVAFGTDQASIDAMMTAINNLFNQLQGSEGSADPNTPESFAAGYITLMPTADAAASNMSIAALTSDFPDAVTLEIGGYPAAYGISQGDPGSFTGVIETEAGTLFMLALATADAATLEDFAAILQTVQLTSAAQSGDLPSVETLLLAEIAPNADIVTMSPLGDLLAYTDGSQLCIYAFGAGSTCYNFPPEAAPAVASPVLQWSSDGRFVALHENSIMQLQDADIYAFEVATGNIIFVSDDGYLGDIPLNADDFSAAGLTTLPIDFAPAWAGNLLYFMRSDFNADGTRSTFLYGSTPGVGQPEALALISDTPEFALSVTPEAWLDGSAVVSPTGALFGGILRPPTTPADGLVFIADIVSGQVEPIATVASINDPRAGDAELAGLSWLPNDSGLLVALRQADNFGNVEYANIYQLDFASATITPLIDYSTLTPEQLPASMPQDVIPFQDGSGFLYVSVDRAADTGWLWGYPLGSSIQLVTSIEAFRNTGPGESSLAFVPGGVRVLLRDRVIDVPLGQ